MPPKKIFMPENNQDLMTTLFSTRKSSKNEEKNYESLQVKGIKWYYQSDSVSVGGVKSLGVDKSKLSWVDK